MSDFKIVGVSGGCDSLALLDILYKKGKKLVVCHVNYKTRESSDRDESIVKQYCKKNNIIFHSLITCDYKEKKDNFENWARIERYNFFKKIYDQYRANKLYLGHHQDDLIETYLLQKKRNIICDYYGIKKENILYGMNVYRPLLNKTKKDLIKYCLENNLEYGEDETNKEFKYERNKIRILIVNQLKEEERAKILQEIKEKNKLKLKQQEQLNKIKKEVIEDDKINLIKFNEYGELEQINLLYDYIIGKFKKKLSISRGRLKDILKKIISKKPNILLWEEDDLLLLKEYDYLVFYKKLKPYSYTIDLPIKEIEKETFKLTTNGEEKDLIIINKNEFPIMILNANGNYSRANKIFKKRKIPLQKRKDWPLIINKNQELLLVLKLDLPYNNKMKNSNNVVNLYIKKKER